MIENLINGNLTDAKRQAKRYSEGTIRFALIEHGFSVVRATLAAAYLKGSDCWQAYCDAE